MSLRFAVAALLAVLINGLLLLAMQIWMGGNHSQPPPPATATYWIELAPPSKAAAAPLPATATLPAAAPLPAVAEAPSQPPPPLPPTPTPPPPPTALPVPLPELASAAPPAPRPSVEQPLPAPLPVPAKSPAKAKPPAKPPRAKPPLVPSSAPAARLNPESLVANLLAADNTAGSGDAAGIPAFGDKAGDSMDAPAPAFKVKPSYPRAARLQGIQGSVTVEFIIGADGEARELLVVAAEPAGVFEDAVLNALQQWRFAPPASGQRKARQVFRFELE